MLVKKRVLGLYELEDLSIDSVKNSCCDNFLNNLEDIYYTCSSNEKNLSDSLITTTKLEKLTDEITFDPNLIKFEYNIPFETLLSRCGGDIRDIDKHREEKAIKDTTEYNSQCVDDTSKVNAGWRTIRMQLEDLQEFDIDHLQIKIFTLGKKDYYCYLI